MRICITTYTIRGLSKCKDSKKEKEHLSTNVSTFVYLTERGRMCGCVVEGICAREESGDGEIEGESRGGESEWKGTRNGERSW